MSQDKIIQKILAKVEAEAKQESTKPHTVGVYRASEIGGCARALQYATLNYPAEGLTPETHLIFKDGHIHHTAVRELLGKIGTMSNVEMTISKQYRHNGQKFTITGTCDGVFDDEVFDVKSISTFRFKYLDKNFPADYLNYVDQLQIYMDILSKKSGFIIFKDKNSAELKIKRLKNDPDLMIAILNRVAEIHKGVKAKELVARPYGRDTWHCKLCSYRLQCWKLPMDKRQWSGGPSHASKDALKKDLIASLAKVAGETPKAFVGHPRAPKLGRRRIK
jgi:CRISPR/Cas system-associated exonuclease Cas4 (RecB family)